MALCPACDVEHSGTTACRPADLAAARARRAGGLVVAAPKVTATASEPTVARPKKKRRTDPIVYARDREKWNAYMRDVRAAKKAGVSVKEYREKLKKEEASK